MLNNLQTAYQVNFFGIFNFLTCLFYADGIYG